MPHMPELAAPKQAPDVVEPQAQPLAPRPVGDALEVGGQAAPPVLPAIAHPAAATNRSTGSEDEEAHAVPGKVSNAADAGEVTPNSAQAAREMRGDGATKSTVKWWWPIVVLLFPGSVGSQVGRREMSRLSGRRRTAPALTARFRTQATEAERERGRPVPVLLAGPDATGSRPEQNATPAPLSPPIALQDHPSGGGRKPQWGWFTKIKKREDALKTINDISMAFFVIAALQAVFGVLLFGAEIFIDVALYVGLAAWLRYGKSRIAAVGLLAVASISMAVTIAAQLNLITGGRNVILAAITLYAAAKAVEATFKLHGRFKTEPTHAANELAEGGAPALIRQHAQRHDYFVRHWRGELSLPVSYWVNGVLISLLAGGTVTFVSYLEFNNSVQPATALFSLVGIYLFSGMLIIWQSVGIWRSASRYKTTKKFWGGICNF